MRRIAPVWILLIVTALSGSACAAGSDALIDALFTHGNHKVRIKAARKLATIRTPEARNALIAATDDEHALVRAAAANSLGRHPSSASISALCSLLGDRDDFVKRTANRTLRKFGGTRGCPAYVLVEVTGDTREMQKRVADDVRGRFADDTGVRVVDVAPNVVKKGKVRGYELKLRLERKVDRSAAGIKVSCTITQSIFDLKDRNLRGSATQRGSLKLGPKAPDPVVVMQIGACMDALAPVVHRGMSDFLARSRR